ncbi:hypothetical protein MBLNU459_g3912t1 [Dothideomycetes sp. NU459]
MRKPTHDQSAAQILAEPGNAEERWLRRIAETSYGKTNKATVDLDLDRWRCNPRVRRYFGRRLFGGRFKPKHQVLDRDNGVSSAENSVLEAETCDDWDTMVIMGRPNFRVTFPGKSKYAMIDPPYLLFRCTGCLEWHKDKHAFEHSDMLQGLYEWDYQARMLQSQGTRSKHKLRKANTSIFSEEKPCQSTNLYKSQHHYMYLVFHMISDLAENLLGNTSLQHALVQHT